MNHTVRLLGGPDDGHTAAIDDVLLRAGCIRIPAPLAFSSEGHYALDPWERATTGAALYRWDGTCNEAGEARFRWAS